MTTFPLLYLSPDVTDRVFQHLTFAELFNLSQCSKRGYWLVKTSPQTPIEIHVQIDLTSTLSLKTSRRNAFRNVSWHFYDKRDPKRLDLENPKTNKIDGRMVMEFSDVRSHVGDLFGCVSDSSLQDIVSFFAYIADLFNAYVREVSIKCRKINCLESVLSFGNLRSPATLSVNLGKIEHKEMHKLLKSSNAEHLSLMCSPGADFIYDQPIRVNCFSAFATYWFTAKMLRELDCKDVDLFRSSLTDEDLNSFLKHWLEGSNTKLQYIKFSGRGKQGSSAEPVAWNLAKIVEGIPTIPGAAKRSNLVQRFDYPRVAYEDGVDLKRVSDGMLATVVILKDGTWKNTCLFEVWKVPNPNVV